MGPLNRLHVTSSNLEAHACFEKYKLNPLTTNAKIVYDLSETFIRDSSIFYLIKCFSKDIFLSSDYKDLENF